MNTILKRSLHISSANRAAPVILSACRTPIATFNGSFKSMTAPQLGAVAVKDAVSRAGIAPDAVDECILGNVVSANIGQAPARQACIGAGLPEKTTCTTVNKVCASGMKTVMLGAQSIMTGHANVVVGGGFESMSNIPYYMPNGRGGFGYGHGQVLDGIVKDGLWDAYGDMHMGSCAEVCAEKYGFSREDQDAYALESYRRSKEAIANGLFADEIVHVHVPQRRGDPKIVSEDEEPNNLKSDKVPSLRPAFKKDGTITAANASSLNDGACALVLASDVYAESNSLKPVARILGFGDAEGEPVWFTTAPSKAVPVALKHAGLSMSDIDYWELNEAFSVVSLANNHLLGLDADKVNVNGGAVSMGHPIGCSGARIITTLLSVLKQKDATIGCAAICNGGGGASSIIIERLI